jgi:hypothetical protein
MDAAASLNPIGLAPELETCGGSEGYSRCCVVERSASGTIIQPTTTIIPDGNGHSKVIVIPRRRSYLDTGTEVSVGDRTFRDYVLPPGGDPGRPYWFFGPDFQGTGRYPLPSAFDGTGLSPNNPF